MFRLVVWDSGARATTHRVVLTSLTFRTQIEGVSVLPTVTQMMPQTRHYVDRRLIFNKFEDMFKDYDDFTRICDVNCLKSIGADFFSKKWFVPGALFSAHRYQV